MGFAVVADSVLDGTGRSPWAPGFVAVEGEFITACGPVRELGRQDNAEVIRVPGATLMPGMIDCHLHVTMHTLRLEERLLTHPTLTLFRAAENLNATLRAGFTTVRDAGGADPGMRQAVEAGLIAGPRLIVAATVGQTGTHLESYFPSGITVPLAGTATRICDGPSAARRVVREAMREGFDLIKVCASGGALAPHDSPFFTELSLDELKAIVETAAAYGRVVMAHAQGTEGIKNAVRAGAWSIEHGSIQDEEATEMMAEAGTYLVPTLSVARWTTEHGREAGISEALLAKGAALSEMHFDSIRKAAAAGVRIAVGTDALGPMHGRNARELQLLVEDAGLSPTEAIVAATKTAADVCRVSQLVGTIEPGKLADLVLIQGEPLRDIGILQDQSRLTVFKGGRVVAAAEGGERISRLTQAVSEWKVQS